MDKTPESGRELVAWLSQESHRLVSVSGHSRRPRTWVGLVRSTHPVAIVILPVAGGREIELHMPMGWDGEGKLTPLERHTRDEGLSFADDGFTSRGVTVKYLDEQDPFSPFRSEENP